MTKKFVLPFHHVADAADRPVWAEDVFHIWLTHFDADQTMSRSEIVLVRICGSESIQNQPKG